MRTSGRVVRSAFCLLPSAFFRSRATRRVPVGVQEPAWAPDGKRIAVSYLDRIWVMTPEGKQARPLTPPSRRRSSASPPGRRTAIDVAFAADKGDGFDIVVLTLKNGAPSGAPIAATAMPGDERWPSWTPDGRLVFAHRDVRTSGRPADPGRQWDLFVDVAGQRIGELAGAARRSRETADSETYPRVSPDGTKVAYVSERDSEDDLDLWWMPVPSAAVAKPTPLGARPARPVTSSVPSVEQRRGQAASSDAHRASARQRSVSVVGAGQSAARLLRRSRRDRIGVGRDRRAASTRRHRRTSAAREAGCPAAARLSQGWGAGVVAGWQDAARLGSARPGAGLQRQSACETSRKRRRSSH